MAEKFKEKPELMRALMDVAPLTGPVPTHSLTMHNERKLAKYSKLIIPSCVCAACVIASSFILTSDVWLIYTKKIERAINSLVAVLEKLASLDDKEEVTRLAADAEGRKFFCKFIACPAPTCKQVGSLPVSLFLIPSFTLCAAQWGNKEKCANPPFLFRSRWFFGELWRNQRHS